MPTLANFNGASLISDFSPISRGIEGIQERRRAKVEESELEALIRGSLGLEQRPQEQLKQGRGLFGALQQAQEGRGQGVVAEERSGGLLGRLAPGLSRMITRAQGNPEQESQIRKETEDGQALASELVGLPSHKARIQRLAQKGGELATSGGDVGRVTHLAHLKPEKLDLELMKMQMIGKEAIAQLPPPNRQDQIASLMARNPQMGGQMLARRDREIAAEQARRERAAARAASQRRASANAAAAAARPKTSLGRDLAGVRSDIASGAISQEVGDQMIANMRSGATASDLGREQDEANLNKTQIGNQILQQQLDAAGGPASFDPKSPIGKLVGDRAGIVGAFGEGSAQAQEFDRMVAEDTTSAGLGAEQAVQSIESTRLANQQSANELADPNSDLSAVEQQIDRIMESQEVDRPTAQAIADGVYKTTRNPVTGEVAIVNVATGTSFKPTNIIAELPSLLPDELLNPTGSELGDPSNMFGGLGFGLNAVNTIVGAVTGGRISPETDKAIQALDNLNTRTTLALAAGVPGRASNETRKSITSLMPNPASVFTGKARAVTQLKQMRSMIGDSLRSADNILRGEGDFSPQDQAASSKYIGQMLPIWEDYNQLIGNLGGDGAKPPSNINTQADFDALPKGARFKLPDGTIGTKE